MKSRRPKGHVGGPWPPPRGPHKPAAEIKPLVVFVGSRKSDVDRYPGCKDCERILPENLVEYTEGRAGERLQTAR